MQAASDVQPSDARPPELGGICGPCAQPDHCATAGCFGAKARGVRLEGFSGRHSTSRKMDYFLSTGEPSVWAKPGAPDYSPALDRATS